MLDVPWPCRRRERFVAKIAKPLPPSTLFPDYEPSPSPAKAPKAPSLLRPPLFHKRLLRDRVADYTFLPDIVERHAQVLKLIAMKQAGKLGGKEVSVHGTYLRHMFLNALGYTDRGHSEAKWQLEPEKRIGASNKSVDAALGFFSADVGTDVVIVPVELKGIDHPLDLPKGRTLSPVQQGWDYANHEKSSRWIIISNYDELRLYACKRTPEAYVSWRLDDLVTLDGFKRFWFLLSREQLLPKRRMRNRRSICCWMNRRAKKMRLPKALCDLQRRAQAPVRRFVSHSS